MPAPPPLADWLATRTPEQLTDLLSRRPDALSGRPPATLGELAERLQHPDSLLAAVRALTRPALQTVHALCALGERRTVAALTNLLGGDDDPAAAEGVSAVLDELTAAGLAWPGDDGRIELPEALVGMVHHPLGLDPPLRELWRERAAYDIEHTLQALGLRRARSKSESLERLLAALADPDAVRSLVARAPEAVAEELHRLASGKHRPPSGGYNPEVYQRALEARRWGNEHGLLVGGRWGYEVTMPAEVALALRGPDWRAPFDVRRPEVAVREVPPDAVEAAASASAAEFAQAALAVLDRITRSPVPRLASGGVGARELGRLTKELGVDETTVRLVLELAHAADLLEVGPDAVSTAPAFDAWRRAEPAERMATLVEGWWRFPGVPTESRDGEGKALRVLRRREPCEGCRASRVALLHALRMLPPGAVSPREVAELALWARPLVHVLPQDAEAPLATVWQEAELLGVVAAGARSPLGTVVAAEDGGALRELLRRLLPASSDRAAFGSDLTAVVTGSPSAEITALLDSCADRESSGSAVTWRFGPGSIRRALDDGVPAGELLDRLAAVSAKELPQPMRYLIEDVARRHGLLRVSAPVSLITSADEALLAEVVADRRLRPLGLRLLAPTVASCQVPLDAALARLREAGYFPVADGGSKAPDSEESAGVRRRPGRQTAARRDVVVRDGRPRAAAAVAGAVAARSLAPVDPAELARRLLAAEDMPSG